MINNSGGSVAGGVIKFAQCTNGKVDLVANNPTAVIEAKSNRAYAAFVNNGVGDITLILGDGRTGAINSGIIIKGGGGSFEITQANLYTGRVSAISASSTQLSFVEGFE